MGFLDNIGNLLRQTVKQVPGQIAQGIGNVASGTLDSIGQRFLNQQPRIASPVPENETLTEPGLLYYVAREQAMEEAARQNPGPTMINKTLVPPQSWANAPQPGQRISLGKPTVVPGSGGQRVQSSSVLGTNTGIPGADAYRRGFERFKPGIPVMSIADRFAEAASRLPKNIDPYLPAVLALMETGGGEKVVGDNNAWNLSGTQNGKRGFVGYPDFATALLGGDNGGVQSQGFVGTVLNDAPYAKFRNTGNLADFFQVYTPPGEEYGNPSMEELLDRYARLRALFD